MAINGRCKAYLYGVLTSGVMFGLCSLITMSLETSGPSGIHFRPLETHNYQRDNAIFHSDTNYDAERTQTAGKGRQSGTSGKPEQSGQSGPPRESQEMDNPTAGGDTKHHPVEQDPGGSPAGKNNKTQEAVLQGTPQGGKPRKSPVALPVAEAMSLDSIRCPQPEAEGSEPVVVPGLDCRKRLPHAIGIGVEKCGTGALSFFLNSHPALAHSEPQEIYFWNQNRDKGFSWYRDQMPVSSRYQVTMEKTPSYVFQADIPERIKASLPDTKFIFLVRDPIVRAVSDYLHLQTVGWPEFYKPRIVGPGQEPLCYLNTTFEGSVIKPDGEVRSDNAILAHSVYVSYFENWLRVFPREQFIIIDGDEFVENPLPILQETERFLGLPRYFDESSVYYDEEKGFYCKTRYKLCAGKSKGHKHPVVDDDVILKLRAYFRPFNEQFEKLVGRKFSWS